MFPYAVTGGADYKPEAWGFVRFSWKRSPIDGRFWFVSSDDGFSSVDGINAVVDDFGNLVAVGW